jgi:hypothetical protein
MVSHLSDSTERQADFIYPFGGVSFTNGSGTEAAVDFFPKLEKHGCVFRPATYSGVLRLRASDSLALEVGATRPYLRGCQTSPFLGIIYIYDPAKDHSDNRGCGGCGW